MTFLQQLNYLPFRYARREVKMCRKYYNSASIPAKQKRIRTAA